MHKILLFLMMSLGCTNNVSSVVDSDSSSDSESDLLSIDEIEKDWVTVPAGEFVYGAPEDQPCRGSISDEQVEVVISRPFKMSSTELTRKQWRMTGLPDPSADPPCDECAQGYVSWFDALYWLNSLSRAAGLEECYSLSNCVGVPAGGCPGGSKMCIRDTEGLLPEIFSCEGAIYRYPARVDCPGYRLPTDAEWEWAARAGTTTSTYIGDISTNDDECSIDSSMEQVGWYCGNSDEYSIHPVAKLLPNAFGLYDMLGNIGEWVTDAYNGAGLFTNEGKIPPLVDPIGITDDKNERRVARGGFVSTQACFCTVTSKYPDSRELRGYWLGFRPIRTILD